MKNLPTGFIRLKKIQIIFILIATFSLLPDSITGQVYVIPEGHHERSIKSYLQIFYDKDRKLNISDIRTSKSQNNFDTNSYSVPFFGRLDGYMWTRLIAYNPYKQDKTILINIKSHSIFSYQINKDGITVDSSGSAYATERTTPLNFRGFVFKIKSKALDTIFFRIEGSYLLRYKIGKSYIEARCTDRKSFNLDFKHNTLFFGFYFGFIFIVIVYTFIVYITYREKSFLWFIVYLVGMALLIIANYDIGMIYLWPKLPDGHASFYINAISNIVTPIGIVMFVRTFFHTKILLPKLDKAMLFFPVIIILTHFINLFVHEYVSLSYIANYLVLSLVLAYYSIVLILSIKGIQYAPVILYSFTCLVIGIILTNLIHAQVIKSDISIAQVMHMSGILFSCLGIIYAIFIFLKNQRREKEKAQSDVIQALKEKELIILKSNDELEVKVKERTSQLEDEKKKSDALLLNILPEEIAEELKESGKSKARLYPNITVFFSDIVNFTGISELMEPEDLVSEIDHCFRNFDTIIEKYNIEKIKTIGDAYMAASGLPTENDRHAHDMLLAAIEIRLFMENYKLERIAANRHYFEMRIGIHSGPAVAGIVGSKKFVYDIWGDTVNTAARMEQNGESGKINISGVTFDIIKQSHDCHYRGKIEAKHKGAIDMYFVK